MKRIDLPYSLTEDHLQVALALPDTFVASAEEVEAMIDFLGRVRSHMNPPVPDRPITGVSITAFTDAPNFIVHDHETGGAVLLLMHPGFGWLHYRFGKAMAEALPARVLAALTPSSRKGHLH